MADLRDWCSENYAIYYEVGAAVERVAQAMNDATRIGYEVGSLDAPELRAAFDRVVSQAEHCSSTTQGAIDLPPIPDPSVEIQFRDAMTLRKRWAEAIADAARRIDGPAFDRAKALGDEATRQGALIAADLRRAWPEGEA